MFKGFIFKGNGLRLTLKAESAQRLPHPCKAPSDLAFYFSSGTQNARAIRHMCFNKAGGYNKRL